MQLHIENRQGTIAVIGNFTANYSQQVKNHFNYLLDHYEEVIMCVHNVRIIDKNAVQVLQEIYEKATRRSKVLFILGKENTTVAKALENDQLSYIFRNDY